MEAQIQNFLQIFTTIFGLLVGSFLNVVIYRIPRNQSVVFPSSNCPSCKHQIKWYENIPILSYLFLKGKCSSCKVKIPLRYPIVELVIGIFAYFLAPKNFSSHELLNFFFYFSVGCIFVSHFLIDIEHQILPDKINLYFLVITLGFVILKYPIKYWLIGGLVGFGGPYLITWIFYKLRGQIGLGGGDIKLFGILGLLLGPIGIMNNIFMSCMLGSIVGIGLIVLKKMDKNKPLAFGPYIIVAAALQVFTPSLFDKINIFSLY